jgi:phosphoglucomutase
MSATSDSIPSPVQAHLSSLVCPSLEARERFLKRCVLSASGLRFIHSGDEEDASTWVCDEAIWFVACAIHEFGSLLSSKGAERVWLGHDARPTGPLFMTMGSLMLPAMGMKTRSMGLGPIPEIMAATHQSGSHGFCYFTASHNPKGHNGLKLGLADGAVLAKAEVVPFIEALKSSYLGQPSEAFMATLKACAQQSPTDQQTLGNDKAEAKAHYSKFALNTVLPNQGDEFLGKVKDSWRGEKPLFLLDMNGSSRLTSVDVEFIKLAGCDVEVMGAEPGVFHHAIIPEGASLEPLRKLMQLRIDEGRRVLGGMVPDCDGDRGNLILVVDGHAKALKAQETFALCAVAEFSTRRALGENGQMALAANGPSSLRLDQLLKPYNVDVHRAEVGEANVLACASQLREKGYDVPMSGEGSNGGNILSPSTVRDPLMTLLSLLKFMALPIKEGSAITAAETLLGTLAPKDPTQRLEAVLNTFPFWTSTDAFEGEALMPVPQIEHDDLKCSYEALLQKHFVENKGFWSGMGILSLAFVSNEGTTNIPGPGGRPQPAKGGLQIFLLGESDERLGFLWMRGSGTEPVFRVMVDWKGSTEDYNKLLSSHRQWITESCVGSDESTTQK